MINGILLPDNVLFMQHNDYSHRITFYKYYLCGPQDYQSDKSFIILTIKKTDLWIQKTAIAALTS